MVSKVWGNRFAVVLVVFSSLVSAWAYAEPVLDFTADVAYTSSDMKMVGNGSVNAVHHSTNTYDAFVGATLSFNSTLSSSMNFDVFNVSTFNDFGELMITDASSNVLLTADMTEVSLVGLLDSSTGIFQASVMVTGGSLSAGLSGENDLFSLVFNVSSNFSDSLFASNFTGEMDGSIEFTSVAEPSMVFLLAFGFAGLIAHRRLAVQK